MKFVPFCVNIAVISIAQRRGKARGRRYKKGEKNGIFVLTSGKFVVKYVYETGDEKDELPRLPKARRGGCEPVGNGTAAAPFELAAMSGTGRSRYRAAKRTAVPSIRVVP